MPLTNTTIRNAKPAEKPIRLYDEKGLYMEIAPSGGRWWRFKYRFDGKEKRLSLGVYPDISLKAARERRDEARQLVANGIDPSARRKAQEMARQNNAANSFMALALEWHKIRSAKWAPSHGKKILRRLELDIFPWLGSKPISEITAPDLLAVLRRIEEKGAIETAHRALQSCGQIFRYAVATGRAERDPSGDLRGALTSIRPIHFPAITEPKAVGELLRAIDAYQGTPVVSAALKLAPMVFVRPGELRTAKWENIDLMAAEWSFTTSKTATQHIVPLSRQAIEILQNLQPITGRSDYVFPSARSNDRPMSDNAILAALRRLEIPKEEMTGHGFRAMARTILDEVLGIAPHIIEHQLAHAVRDPLGRAYNRTSHMPDRKRMMQLWADYLDGLKQGAKVVPLRAPA